SNNNIVTGYLNTFFYVIASTIIGMFFTVMAAYALSRKDFLWANPLMLGISFTMMFSGGIIPFYLVVTQTLNMYDSRWALIIPSCMSAFNLILVRTALQGVPASLEESAMLDGAGRFTILFRIMLPLIKATLATVVLYFVIGNWNSWFNAMIFLRTRSKFPLQLILREILITADSSTTTAMGSATETGDSTLYKQLIKYCTIMVSTVPMFIFYPFIQKYFESGVMIGAIKG
ncbi:MAG TPA: carbohydrate ABC transporter permease, partial [Candidatus Faecivivens stercorigallinarum]|nr:carbohydrate ABC transporter permease [Candidatus Faecivivens stercorigallinarum]